MHWPDQAKFLALAIFMISFGRRLAREARSFLPIENNKGLKKDGPLELLETGSEVADDGIIDCLSGCVDKQDCDSVQFNELTNECRLWGAFEGENEEGVASILIDMPRWNFYQKDCEPGENREMGTCIASDDEEY